MFRLFFASALGIFLAINFGTSQEEGSSLTSNNPTCCNTDCSSGFHFFEKVQDLPTRGAYGVEHFTINGTPFLAFANYYGDISKHKTRSMVYKMEESSEKFALYQTLQTRGAHGVLYFSIADKHFIAVSNWYDNTYDLDSVIFQWNGRLFVVFQALATRGDADVTFFTINDDKYLAAASYLDGKTVIFKWSGVRFDKFQEISTEGRAIGCTAFAIKNDIFIAISNYHGSRNKFATPSIVFKWGGGNFVKFQSLQTYGAYDVKFFQINGHNFLAFANKFSGSKHDTASFIYKWNGNKFVLFQSIPTRGAIALYPFVISGKTFLGVANHETDGQGYHTTSAVFQASGSRFVTYQEIPTQGAGDVTSFEYKGHTYLVFTNHNNGQKRNINSALYKWV